MQIYFFAAIFAYLFIYLFFLQGVPFILTTIVALVWVTLNNPYSLCKYVFVHSGYDDIILFSPSNRLTVNHVMQAISLVNSIAQSPEKKGDFSGVLSKFNIRT